MPEIRIVLADDEPLARRGLQQLLAAHEDCTIVAESRNGRETVRALRRLQPDVLFLDIQMPNLNGFQVLQALEPERPPIIVFVTAYDEFALRAFDAHALDYLLKPVSQERFDRMLERVRARLRSDRAVQLTRELVSLLATRAGHAPDAALSEWSAAAGARSIVVPTETGDLVIDPAEIDWIQAEDYYAAVYALGRRHLIRESLASLEQRLDPRQFVRVHRSALVRLDRVRELRSEPVGSTLVLRDGTRIPVSRRRRERVAALIRRR
jgi:two-component system LytT family response regulator